MFQLLIEKNDIIELEFEKLGLYLLNLILKISLMIYDIGEIYINEFKTKTPKLQASGFFCANYRDRSPPPPPRPVSGFRQWLAVF